MSLLRISRHARRIWVFPAGFGLRNQVGRLQGIAIGVTIGASAEAIGDGSMLAAQELKGESSQCSAFFRLLGPADCFSNRFCGMAFWRFVSDFPGCMERSQSQDVVKVKTIAVPYRVTAVTSNFEDTWDCVSQREEANCFHLSKLQATLTIADPASRSIRSTAASCAHALFCADCSWAPKPIRPFHCFAGLGGALFSVAIIANSATILTCHSPISNKKDPVIFLLI